MTTKNIGHPHAASMLLYAQDAAETDKPWERWELRWLESRRPEWYTLNSSPGWALTHEYRRKPKTIRIGNVDVPEPYKGPLKPGQRYWITNILLSGIYPVIYSNNFPQVVEMQRRGIVHLTEEAAVLHAKALILVSGGTVD